MKQAVLKLYNWTNLDEIGNSTCLEYSEEPEKLKELLSGLKVSVKVKAPNKSHWNDDLKCLPITVRIERDGRDIEFDYFGSHVDAMAYLSHTRDNLYALSKQYGNDVHISTSAQSKAKKEFTENLKYSILCSIGSDLLIPEWFEDFCAEFGYNEDSIKGKELFEKCRSHQRKLLSIFSQDEVECMPR
jgi:hypothetical protein